MLARRLAILLAMLCIAAGGLGLILPDVFGLWAPRRYLILAQNSDELRPTGGFISGAALVVVRYGRLVEFEISDANLVDDFTRSPYPSPPEPLRRYMGSQLWVFRDSNWSPDFPTSARMAMELYALGTGHTVDGVIAIDQAFLRALLAVAGPVAVPGLPKPVSEANFVPLLRGVWSARPGDADYEAWQTTRKDFLGPVAEALVVRLSGVRDLHTALELIHAVTTALAERHVLVYLRDVRVAHLLAWLSWDGAVRPDSGDYLRVVDSNIGFNKVNGLVEQRLAYHVDLSDPALPLADLAVHYANTVPEPEACIHETGEDREYQSYLHDCYWNYWRILAPAAIVVLDAPANAVPGEQLITGQADFQPARVGPGANGTAEVAGLFVLPPGQTHVVPLTYLLPSAVLTDGPGGQLAYRLRVQKQPGTGAVPLELSLAFSPAWSIARTTHAPIANSPGLVRYDLSLRTDVDFEVVFRRP